MDEDKFGNKRHSYIMPLNELTIKERHCKETAGHLGTTKRLKKLSEGSFGSLIAAM